VPSWSIQNRLFTVIAGMAILASATIGAVRLSTEGEWNSVQADEDRLIRLHGEVVRLAGAIRDQEAGLGDYLLSHNADALERFRGAVAAEAGQAERIRLDAAADPKILAALDQLVAEAGSWRADVAYPAVFALERGATEAVAEIAARMASDQGPTIDTFNALLATLDDAEAAVDVRDANLVTMRAVSGAIAVVLMALIAGATLILSRRWVTRPLGRLLRTVNEVEHGADAPFVVERDDEIGKLGAALERMRSALQRDVDQSSVLNRFTEVTTFAADDAAVARSNLEALQLLVAPDAAVNHVLNRSKDRAVPEAVSGAAAAEILPLHARERCPGVQRGSVYINADATQPLSVHCAIYPVDRGTLACVPLAHGETVGSVHLYWERPNAFEPEARPSVIRVAEHAALAIGNRRLLAALRGMASTDPRTGLMNTATFDQQLEDALNGRQANELIAVLMLDLDHFKDFNDRYGHPAGDEALRTFAKVLQSCLRDGDLAARYGGEEFAVALPGVEKETAIDIAERIRARTDTTLISLAPGISDRISVSIGIAFAPDHAQDRIALLRLADEALYRAKEAGRNRVAVSAATPLTRPSDGDGDLAAVERSARHRNGRSTDVASRSGIA
jgi:diguanylate cyclase (GGDEF)-like protein